MNTVPPAPETEGLSVSQRLQAGTRVAHDRVERRASFNRLIVVRVPADDPGASAAARARRERALQEYREVYRRFLIAAHGFEAAVDRALDASPALEEAIRLGYTPEPNSPTALIREDLARVFGPASEVDVGRMEGLPEVLSLAELAGVEYVRRGSRAGGAVIAAVVQQNLGFSREDGASFLAQYGKQTRSVVASYKAWVDGLALPEPDAERAVGAAVDTFLAVERWHLRLEEHYARG